MGSQLQIPDWLSWQSVLAILGLTGFFAGLLVLILSRSPVVEFVEVSGVVVGSFVVASNDTVQEHYMRVRLPSGREARVRVSTGLPILPGRVVVLRRSAAGNDSSPHRFLHYLERGT